MFEFLPFFSEPPFSGFCRLPFFFNGTERIPCAVTLPPRYSRQKWGNLFPSSSIYAPIEYVRAVGTWCMLRMSQQSYCPQKKESGGSRSWIFRPPYVSLQEAH